MLEQTPSTDYSAAHLTTPPFEYTTPVLRCAVGQENTDQEDDVKCSAAAAGDPLSPRAGPVEEVPTLHR